MSAHARERSPRERAHRDGGPVLLGPQEVSDASHGNAALCERLGLSSQDRSLVGAGPAYTDIRDGTIRIQPDISVEDRQQALTYEQVNRQNLGTFQDIHHSAWSGELSSASAFARAMLGAEQPAIDQEQTGTPSSELRIGSRSAESHYASLFPQVQGGAVAAISKVEQPPPKTGLRTETFAKSYAEKVQALKDELGDGWFKLTTAQRAEEVTRVVNEFLFKEGIPPLEIQVADLEKDPKLPTLTTGGSIDSETGKLKLDKSQIDGSTFDQVSQIIYHEALHRETDYRMAQYANQSSKVSSQEAALLIPGYLLKPQKTEGESEESFLQREEIWKKYKPKELEKGSDEFADAKNRFDETLSWAIKNQPTKDQPNGSYKYCENPKEIYSYEGQALVSQYQGGGGASQCIQ